MANMRIPALVLLLCFFSVVQAAQITQDQPILLNQENQSQIIQISLDAIPEKLIKRNSQIKNQNIKVKFVLKKKDRKNFELNPKNGRVIIQIKDGEIIPASLTITAKDPSVEVITDYKIKVAKKLRKRLKIDNYSGILNLSEKLFMSVTIAIPNDDLDKYPFVARLEENRRSGKNSIIANEDDVVLSFWNGSGFIQTPPPDTIIISPGEPEALYNTFDPPQSLFKMDILSVFPPAAEGFDGVFGAAFLMTLPSNESQALLGNITSNNLLISSRSTFVAERIITSGIDPREITLDEVRELIALVDGVNLNGEDLSSTAKILELIEKDLGESLDLLIQALGNTDLADEAGFDFESQTYVRYSVKARSYEPSSLLFNQYEATQFDYYRNPNFPANQIWATLYNLGKFRDTPIITSDRRASFLSASNNAFLVRPPRQFYNPYKYFRKNNTFFGSAFYTSANTENRVLSLNNDVIFEHFTDVFEGAHGFDSFSFDRFTPINTDLTVTQNFRDVFSMFGVEIGQFKGSQTVDLAENFRDLEPWVLGFGTFQDENGFMKFENIFTKCSTGDEKTCDADFISITSAYNSETGKFDLSNIFSPAIDGTLKVSGSHKNPDLDFRWSGSENWEKKVSKFDSLIDFNRASNFAVKLQSQAETKTTDSPSKGVGKAASMLFLLKSSDQFANYVGDYYIYGLGYETSTLGHDVFLRSGNLQYTLDDNNEPVISMQMKNGFEDRFLENLGGSNAENFTEIVYNNENTELQNLIVDMEVDTPKGLEVVRCMLVEGDEVLACRFYDANLDRVEDNVETPQVEPVHMGLFFAVKKRGI